MYTCHCNEYKMKLAQQWCSVYGVFCISNSEVRQSFNRSFTAYNLCFLHRYKCPDFQVF